MPAGPTFAGAQACAGCHQLEFKRWMGSHHQLAMQPANDSTVSGDFHNVKFTNGKITSTFFKTDGKFMVRTDGPDGALHDYQIQFSFGVFPLQQYLIAMSGGRLQALGIAWDSRPTKLGGQHWFFLYPGQKIPASDPLHWTGIDQTWNYMCADCHSTNVRKNYNPRTRSYETSYAEINVACEACHGPGSDHLMWAKKLGNWKQFDANQGLTITLNERKAAEWTTDSATGQPRRITPQSESEIEMCARCHSRRGQIHEDYVHGQPAGDDYRIALLDQDLYFPDGQIKGEVYEYGSFLQSRMYREGVTCSDCHEPHSLKLRAEGNNVCLQCHAARYDSPLHHHHKAGSAGALCANCHMPTRTYMVVDARRDHSIRIPRPDQSQTLGTPNACNECHADKSPQWASDTLYKWYGHAPSGFQKFAQTLNDARRGAPPARQELSALIADRQQAAIARATALSLLAPSAPDPAKAAVAIGMKDDSALVRRATAQALSNLDLQQNPGGPTQLLSDPVRSVRIQMAEVMAGVGSAEFPAEVSAALDGAIAEYIAAQELDADRPEAHMNIALLFQRQGQTSRAEAELRTALLLEPSFVPAAVDLADLYRGLGRDADGENVLRSALIRTPEEPSLLHALGLLMVREKQIPRALELLSDATHRDPANPRYAYVYAVALGDFGRTPEAITVLKTSLKFHPYDRDSLHALINFLQQAGNYTEALIYAQRLNELEPDNPEVRQTLSELSGRNR